MSKNIEKYIPHIHHAAQFFNEHFVNKYVIYSTKNHEITIRFIRSNFMHLCGIKYQLGARKFFDDALENKLKKDRMLIKNDGTTYLKLSLLKDISSLITENISLTGNATYLHLKFDHALRTKRQILALTLLNEDFLFIPISLLNLTSIQNFPNGSPIIQLKSIDLSTREEKIYFTSSPQ